MLVFLFIMWSLFGVALFTYLMANYDMPFPLILVTSILCGPLSFSILLMCLIVLVYGLILDIFHG